MRQRQARGLRGHDCTRNHLLAKGSQTYIRLQTSLVFWQKNREHPAETLFRAWDSGLDTGTVKALLAAPNSGVGFFEDEGTRFYVLGLAPNAARIAVRFWHMNTVETGRRSPPFHDLHIDHAPHEPERSRCSAYW